MSKRIMQELKKIQKETLPEGVISLKPIEENMNNNTIYNKSFNNNNNNNLYTEDLFSWIGVIKGPNNSFYQDGEFKLKIVIPKTYPIHPPNIKFLTKISHPNVDLKTGEICLDILKQGEPSGWSPAWNLVTVCIAIRALLEDPQPDSPLNVDSANLYRSDPLACESLVKFYVWRYACKHRNNKKI